MGFISLVIVVLSWIYLILNLGMPLPLITLAYVFLRPVSPTVYTKLICLYQGSWLVNVCFFLEKMAGVQIRVTGEPARAEPALILSNHQTHDWICMYTLGLRSHTLGFIRTVIKAAIRLVPFFGWAIALCRWPFVSRDFKKDEKTLNRLFRSYRDAGLPVQVWIFPEGTRLCKSKLEASQAYAREKGYAVWKHVMLPRHRGFITALNGLQGVISVIYETTISYQGWPKEIPGIVDLITTDLRKPHVVHIHINRVDVATVPEDDNGRQKWLHESFARKELLLEFFEQNKQFPGKNTMAPPSTLSMLPHVIIWFISFIGLFQLYKYIFTAIFSIVF